MSNIENAVALLRNMNPESLDAEKVINSLSGDELYALESVDDLESLVGGHARAIHSAAGKKPNVPKYKRHANVSLLITRTLTVGATTLVNGSNQSVALPAPCFGVLEDASDYVRVLAAYLPPDGSVKIKTTGRTTDGRSRIFTFQNAGDTIEETITIAMSNGNPYPNLVRAMEHMRFDIIEPKFMISDTTKTTQFDQSINIFKGSPFTALHTDSINPQEYKTDILSDTTIRIFRKLTIHVNPEKTVVPMIVAPSLIAGGTGSTFYTTMVCSLGIISE